MRELFGAPARESEVCRNDLLVSMLVMAWFVEARDPDTGGHLWRVSRLARGLAQASGLSRADVAKVTLGGLLHDLGKIAVPDHVVRKPDKLDDGEYALMKTHPEAGWRMLASHPLAFLVEGAVRAHHERPDGLSNPLGLKADEIPLEAEIVGICDAFDAMTSARPYRRGMPVETVEPHSAQKYVWTLPPLAAVRVNCFAAPETATAARGSKAPTPKGAPVRRWHSRQ